MAMQQLLRFLTAVSSCRGTPVVSNQAACLHTMWINPDHRARLLLETRAFDTDGRGEATHAKCIPELHWEAEHSDAALAELIKLMEHPFDGVGLDPLQVDLIVDAAVAGNWYEAK